MNRITLIIVGGFFASFALFVLIFVLLNKPHITSTIPVIPTPTAIPTPTTTPIPSSYSIPQRKHMFQSFNNCGPATLSMALSLYGIDVSQETLGQKLRPYQVAGGDNDDKSVTLQEVAEEGRTYGLTPYLRPNGTIEKLEAFIALDIPVIARTWLQANDDIGHYRVIRGYDQTAQTILQDDSLQGANLTYSYNEFLDLWKPFNYEYLVLVPQDKIEAVEKILGDEVDTKVAWSHSLNRIQNELTTDPDNVHLLFNLAINYYYVGEYQKAIDAYENVQGRLTLRRLWYQMEPILAYYETGDYDTVLSISDHIINTHNRAYSELYILRGNIFKSRGNIDAARAEYEKAVFYNTSMKKAQEALNTL